MSCYWAVCQVASHARRRVSCSSLPKWRRVGSRHNDHIFATVNVLGKEKTEFRTTRKFRVLGLSQLFLPQPRWSWRFQNCTNINGFEQICLLESHKGPIGAKITKNVGCSLPCSWPASSCGRRAAASRCRRRGPREDWPSLAPPAWGEHSASAALLGPIPRATSHIP